jgi:putative FmdB family regulatory protein
VPLYEFRCGSCGLEFEELTAPETVPPCPRCGSAEPRRLLSSFAPTPRFGLRGGDARRSEAERRARRERERERRGKG